MRCLRRRNGARASANAPQQAGTARRKVAMSAPVLIFHDGPPPGERRDQGRVRCRWPAACGGSPRCPI